MITLYDQFGRPLERTAKKPERSTLAAAPIRDSWREYVASGLTPVKLATLFKEADSGDVRRQAELFEQIEERDGHILGEISKRRNVILDVDFQVTPASEDSRDVKVAEAVTDMIESIADWADVLVSLQDAVGKGFSAIELVWDVSEGQARVEDFKFIEQKRFIFYDAQGLLSNVPRLITDDDPIGVDIPAFKMLFHRYGGKSGHAARTGIYRICSWWYLFKNYAIKDWMVFCECYGMPLRLGKYDAGASKADRDALETAVRMLGSDAAGIISKSTEIEFVQGNKGSSGADLYKDLAAFGNKEMSKAILGSTLTADVDGKGSYAAANTHNEVRLDLLRADSRALAATIRNQLIRPFVGFNFGWDTPCPKYEGDFKEEEDLKLQSEIIEKLSGMMDIPTAYVRKKFSIPEPEKGEECLFKPAGQQTAKPETARIAASLSLEEDTDTLDSFSDKLQQDIDPIIQNRLDAIKKILSTASTLDEVREKLLDTWKDRDAQDIGVMMQKAMILADLTGRYEIQEEAQG